MSEQGSKIASTTVWHNGIKFLVSTINRACSALGAHNMIYAETLVFMGDDIVFQDEGMRDSITTHIATVELVHQFGENAQQEKDRINDELDEPANDLVRDDGPLGVGA